jgi:2-polyprenyl-3-methyl-5-hydroxy-6-metoxy-1,4-benzoquinol methylase
VIAARLYFELERRREPLGAALKRVTGQRLADLAHALYKGVWLGALDDDQLAAITQIYYAERGPEWRHIRWTELGLKPWEQEAIDQHFAGRRSLLVGCAGGGREVFALARRGFAVSAFDCSPSLVESARAYAAENELAVRYAFSAPDHVPDLGMHDGAIVGWGGYMHIIGAERRIAFLRRFRAQLEPGSPLLVSFYVRSENDAALSTMAAVGTFVRRTRRKKAVELGDELRPRFFRRTFTRADVEREFGAAGFQVAAFSQEHEYAVGTAL